MSVTLFSSANVGQTIIPAGQLSAAIFAYQKDLQTGLVDINLLDQSRHNLLFAHGELVNIYQGEDEMKRVDQRSWGESLNSSRSTATMRALALTPQAVRIAKILIEQANDMRHIAPVGQPLEALFDAWIKHPVHALAYIRWPSAEALMLLPGEGGYPRYTLFVSADQMLHSAGTMSSLYRWKEPYESARLLSSEPRTLAWTEYLLHHSFSWLVTHLLERFGELTDRMTLNNMVRDINFTSSAHGWGVLVHQSSITDQTIFSSPKAAAEVYSRLIQFIFGHIEAILGYNTLELLVKETVLRLSLPCRLVVEEYLLISIKTD
jgi:hypothetical protein